MEFKNKIACITGASVGIGRATAILFAQHGADLILIDINGEKLDLVKRELEEYDVSVKTYVCDVSDEAAVYAALSDKKVGLIFCKKTPLKASCLQRCVSIILFYQVTTVF